jgi:hypothetical protein
VRKAPCTVVSMKMSCLCSRNLTTDIGFRVSTDTHVPKEDAIICLNKELFEYSFFHFSKDEGLMHSDVSLRWNLLVKRLYLLVILSHVPSSVRELILSDVFLRSTIGLKLMLSWIPSAALLDWSLLWLTPWMLLLVSVTLSALLLGGNLIPLSP